SRRPPCSTRWRRERWSPGRLPTATTPGPSACWCARASTSTAPRRRSWTPSRKRRSPRSSEPAGALLRPGAVLLHHLLDLLALLGREVLHSLLELLPARARGHHPAVALALGVAGG